LRPSTQGREASRSARVDMPGLRDPSRPRCERRTEPQTRGRRGLTFFSAVNYLLTERVGIGGGSHYSETWMVTASKGLLGDDLGQLCLQMRSETQGEELTQRRFNST